MSARPSTRTVVITGAGSGIGRATALTLGRAGFDIALLGREVNRLQETAQALNRHHVRSLVIPIDVTSAPAVQNAAATVEEKLGPIAVWVNCAGVSVFGQVSTLQAADIQRATHVTYMGSIHGTLAALEVMRRRGVGTIINLDLASHLRDLPLQAVENGARAGLRAFCESLRTEIEHDADRIRVVMVNLPAINTPRYGWTHNQTGKIMQPYGPVYAPEVAAEAICRAVFNPSDSISIGFCAFLPNFLQNLMPYRWRRHRATHGYKTQMGHDWLETLLPDSLYTPVQGCFAANGAYDEKAHRLDSLLSVFVSSQLHARLTAFFVTTFLLFWLWRSLRTKK
ncbi:MAG: SDR family NAD(P)-dependent oxidoreductase [Acetobacter sp.]|nr:SDR family NAD(P)-dependent oxidoreductase [Acetobacter sp.]